MSPAGYPLASLLSLRARERDQAARKLGAALDLLAAATEARAEAARVHDRATQALEGYQPLEQATVGAGALELRARHRERLRDARDQAWATLQQATDHQRAAEAHVETTRALLAEAQAAHRAVELHEAEHRARTRAAAQAREEDALDELVQARARGSL